MTSTSGDGPQTDDSISATNHDAEADESFATAADEWQYQTEDEVDNNDKLEQASADEAEDNLEINGDYYEGDDEDTLSKNDSLDQNPEDDTLPSLDEELRAQQDASDSSIFQGPSPQVSHDPASMFNDVLTFLRFRNHPHL